MWLQASNETTPRRLPVYLHHQTPACQSTIIWNQVCVLTRHKLRRFFFGKTLLTTDIAPACCYKKDWQFSRKIWASEVHTFGETVNWLILFCGFRGGNTKFAEIGAGSLSRVAASSLDFGIALTPRAFVLEREPARRLTDLVGDHLTLCDHFSTTDYRG